MVEIPLLLHHFYLLFVLYKLVQDIGLTTTNSGLIYGSYYLTTQDIYGCEVFDTRKNLAKT